MYLFTHRKDLRITDLRAFDYIIRNHKDPGLHLLILDPALTTKERLTAHSGRSFLTHAAQLIAQYADAGQTLHLLYGQPADITAALLGAYPAIDEVIVHADYTPYARQRDEQLQQATRHAGRKWLPLADAPLADLEEFHTFARRSEPYKVFTPFHRMWSTYMQQHYAPAGRTTVRDLHTVGSLDSGVAARFALPPAIAAALAEGAERAAAGAAPEAQGELSRFVRERLSAYGERRDDYAAAGTSGLARFLNAGAISAREAYESAQGSYGADTWIRQLAWRDFYLYQAMFHENFFRYEHLVDQSPLSDRHFEAWATAQTGVPIIDAAMTQLLQTGELPNRLRMVTAMFLTKNLLCPFTLGEQHFRLHLSDYDNTLNRGGWLWSSSLGYDAAPYFRIMNPVTQSQTHNPSGDYIRRWLPELAHQSDRDIHLPEPHAIVDVKASRARAIEVYKTILA